MTARILIFCCLWGIGNFLFAQSSPNCQVSQEALCIYGLDAQKPFLTLSKEIPYIRGLETKRSYSGKLGSYKVKDKVKDTYSDWSTFPTQISNGSGNPATFKGSLKNKKGRTLPVTLYFTLISPSVLEFQIQMEGTNRVEFAFDSPAKSPAFGFGEQFSYLDRKGHEFWMLVEEQGVGRGDHGTTFWPKLVGASGTPYTSYCPLPFFFLDSGRAVSLEPSGPLYFNLTDSTQIWVRSDQNSLKGRIYLGETPLEVLEKYTADAGRFPELPDWAFGTWIGMQGGSEKAKQIVKEAIDAGNPVTGLWIQDWVGQRETAIGTRLNWDWHPDSTRYPDLKGFCKEMKANGVHVMGYLNPFLVEGGRLQLEAERKGYLVKNQEGAAYELAAGGFNAYILDLSREEVRKWTQEMIHSQMIEQGFSGWMADFGEWLPFDAKLSNDLDVASFHNTFPVAWVKVNREAVDATGHGSDFVFFNRAGYAGINQHAKLLWAGDQMTDWGPHDGLPSAIRALLSSGMSGISLNHSDLGGYTGLNLPFTKRERDRELLYRWAEFSAFTPIFRTHEGLRPESNIQVYSDVDAVQFFAKMGQIHFALKPYLQAANQEASQTGAPIVRHLWLAYPEDPQVKEADDCYLLGRDILVFPVTKAGKTQIDGYFPDGNWVHLFSGEVLQGGKNHLVPVPVGTPAAYIKQESKWKNDLRLELGE